MYFRQFRERGADRKKAAVKDSFHATEIELERIHVTGLELERIHVTGLELERIHVTGLELEKIHVTGLELERIHVTGLELERIHVTGLELEKIHVTGLELERIHVTGLELERIHVTGLELERIHLTGLELERIHLTGLELESRGRTRSKAANRTLRRIKVKVKSQDNQSSPQRMGQIIHKKLAEQLKNGTRDGIEGEILKKMEDNFSCEFLQAAEVSISGFAVERKTRRRKTELQVDFWSGKMDAVAIRRSTDGLEIFVVDWKTSGKEANLWDISNWWNGATKFKVPLYQCLVYRELLSESAHLTRYNVEGSVGIMLVPLHQLTLKLHPGLCVDFQGMVEEHLLDGLNKLKWFAVLDDSIYVHTIKLPCKLFKESFDPAVDVDESTNVLKGDTRLKDVLNEIATVTDLLQALDLPFLKVEGIKEEKKKAQKDDKTSGIEIASSTKDKTNEELEEVKQKGKSSSSHREAQDTSIIPLLPKKAMKRIKKL